MRYHRHRRGHYALAERPSAFSFLRPFVGSAIILIVLFYIGTSILSYFGVGSNLQQTGAVLRLDGRGNVSVSLNDSAPRRAEDDLKLYPGDSVQTGSNGHAIITFFDDTRIRLDEGTDIEILKSTEGEDSGSIALKLSKGSLWALSPKGYAKTVDRTVETDSLSLSLVDETELVLSEQSVVVFAAKGIGIDAAYLGGEEPIIIGEGQQFTVPQGQPITGDPYEYRRPLDPTVVRSSFVEESRSRHISEARIPDAEDDTAEEGSEPDRETLVVTSPAEGTSTTKSTVTVSGRVSGSVESVRANGYTIDVADDGNFSQELALSDDDEVAILIEALSTDGTVLAESRRSVIRDRQPPAAPVISAPAGNGETYQTAQTQFEIQGTVTKDVIGIEVNDYRLQLFDPGDTTWSYLASTKLDNIKYGTNEFRVTAINEGGLRSEEAVLTIVLTTDGAEGVVGDAEGSEESEEAEDIPVIDGELPDNDPLAPGSLKVEAPTAGESHRASGTGELLIEGVVSPSTFSVWVNDYRLRLYEPGKSNWNYRASTEIGTMKRGRNEYEIVTRNRDGKILDTMTYVVELQ